MYEDVANLCTRVLERLKERQPTVREGNRIDRRIERLNPRRPVNEAVVAADQAVKTIRETRKLIRELKREADNTRKERRNVKRYEVSQTN